LRNVPSTEETIKGEKFKFEVEGQIHTIENVNKTTETTGRSSICIRTKKILITGMARPNADSAPHLILARAKAEDRPSATEYQNAPFHLLTLDMHIAFRCLHAMVLRDHKPTRTVGSQPFFAKRGPQEFAMKAWSSRLRHVGDRGTLQGLTSGADKDSLPICFTAQCLGAFKESTIIQPMMISNNRNPDK
jgi:hypothetical protein